MIKQGSIVKPTAGKAQDRYFVVLSIEGRRAAISDGRKRKLQMRLRTKTLWISFSWQSNFHERHCLSLREN